MLGFEDISASPRGNSIHTTVWIDAGCVVVSAARRAFQERHVFARKWSRRTTILLAAAAVAVIFATVASLGGHRATVSPQVPFSDLLSQLDHGAVAAVAINGDTLDFTLTDGNTLRTVAPANYVTGNASFVPALAARHVRI